MRNLDLQRLIETTSQQINKETEDLKNSIEQLDLQKYTEYSTP